MRAVGSARPSPAHDARLDRTEQFAKELGGPVGDLRLCGEAGFRRHEDEDFDDALDGRERTDLLPDGGQGVQSTGPGERLRVLGGDLGADLARRDEFAGDDGQLTCRVDEVAGTYRGDIGGQRRDDLRQLDALLRQAL